MSEIESKEEITKYVDSLLSGEIEKVEEDLNRSGQSGLMKLIDSIQSNQPQGISLLKDLPRSKLDLDTTFELHYQHPNGSLFLGSSIEYLSSLPSSSVDVVFADPPFNSRKVSWDFMLSPEKYNEWCLRWVKQSERILKSSGTLFIFGSSEILADVKHYSSKYFPLCRWLIWYFKNKTVIGNTWGDAHESILCFRKSDNYKFNLDDVRIPYAFSSTADPVRLRGSKSYSSELGQNKPEEYSVWNADPRGSKPKDVFDIPVTSRLGGNLHHPSQKPEELIRRLMLAVSDKGDLIVAPFSGVGTVPVAAEQLGRRWSACDSNQEYNLTTINRIESIISHSKEWWIEYDNDLCRRRLWGRSLYDSSEYEGDVDLFSSFPESL